MSFLRNLYKNRRVIINLAKNDFSSKYAGSFLGITWAFVQPVVNTIIYAFVFGSGLRSGPVNSDFPFLLFLISGIIPWFFFNDAVNSGTNSVLSYGYILKKMVFNASNLPIIKIISSLFVHLFFILLGIVVFFAYGHRVTLSIIQVLYYTFCVFMLSLALSYITSAIVVFFKDLSQIVSIVLQFSLWLTPIMYEITTFSNRSVQMILKLNPLYYITEGYRDAFYRNVWFFEKPLNTLYFWSLVLVLMFVGVRLFKRLSSSFVDVL